MIGIIYRNILRNLAPVECISVHVYWHMDLRVSIGRRGCEVHCCLSSVRLGGLLVVCHGRRGAFKCLLIRNEGNRIDQDHCLLGVDFLPWVATPAWNLRSTFINYPKWFNIIFTFWFPRLVLHVLGFVTAPQAYVLSMHNVSNLLLFGLFVYNAGVPALLRLSK